ncbi:MAG: methyltransferase domain-containing protein [Aggregatilineales bacterium]
MDDKAKILDANIHYHTAMADQYDQLNPHTSAENRDRVESIIKTLAQKTNGDKLIDLGCGTGFMLNVSKAHFNQVVGIDITPAMLERIDRTSPRAEIILELANTEAIPYPDNTFDVCTAYSFLHHLYDLPATLKEAYRVLKPGGWFYCGLEPNQNFWELVSKFASVENLPPSLAREVRNVLQIVAVVADEIDVTEEQVTLAEYQKIVKGGFTGDDVLDILRTIGFEEARIEYDWYLGQGQLSHEQGIDHALIVDNYLKHQIPATKHLFKYLSFFAKKSKND